MQIALGAIVTDALYPEEEFHGKIPHYPYMRMRDAKPGGFPWGECRAAALAQPWRCPTADAGGDAGGGRGLGCSRHGAWVRLA